MNDPEFIIFLNDMMTIREGGKIKSMVKKTVENSYVGLIEHVRQLIKNGTLMKAKM